MTERIAPSRTRTLEPGFAERLLRGVALGFLSVFLFYLKLLATVVRLGIGAVKKAGAAPKPARRETGA